MRRSQKQKRGWSYSELVRLMHPVKEKHLFNPLYSEIYERPTRHCRECGKLESEHEQQ